MGIFSFFTKKPNTKIPVVSSGVIDAGSAIEKPMDPSVAAPEDAVRNTEHDDDVISIVYGTGMPIDVIYAFINKDNEKIGYDDALTTSDASYCQTKEEILRNQLKNLIQRVCLKYTDEIRQMDAQIANDTALFALTSVQIWKARRQMCEEHLKEIEHMKRKFDEQAPEMLIMVNSYHRGFMKGCVARASNFINKK